MAKPTTPRLELREYDVHLEGNVRSRIKALSPEAAELDYRSALGLRRTDLHFKIVDITAQRERNNGLTDHEARQRKQELAADIEMAKKKAQAAVELSTAEMKAKAKAYLEAAARHEELAAKMENAPC